MLAERDCLISVLAIHIIFFYCILNKRGLLNCKQSEYISFCTNKFSQIFQRWKRWGVPLYVFKTEPCVLYWGSMHGTLPCSWCIMYVAHFTGFKALSYIISSSFTNDSTKQHGHHCNNL